MIKIGLLSDTHGYIDESVYRFFEDCEELWHAGDVGNVNVIETLKKFKPIKGVFGNIDDFKVKHEFSEFLRFLCEDVDVYITHIGGYPGKYSPPILNMMKTNPPTLFITGHSHILRVMFDKQYQCLHINPGAAGKYGFHQKLTLIRFSIEGNRIFDLDVFEKEK